MSPYKIPRGVKKLFSDNGIPLIKVADPSAARRIGIHLLCPTRRELEDALETAMRDLYPAVLVHDFKTWGYHHGYHRNKPKLTLIIGGAA